MSMSKASKSDNLDEAKRIAARLLAMPPKPHDEMKLGRKAKAEAGKSPARKSKPEKRGE